MANLAQRAAKTPIHTFTLAFEEQELNEGPIAKRIAAAIGTEHHEVVLTEGHFVGNLETALDSLDQPTVDGLNAYYMSQAIRRAGFTVALASNASSAGPKSAVSLNDTVPFLASGWKTAVAREWNGALFCPGASLPPLLT